MAARTRKAGLESLISTVGRWQAAGRRSHGAPPVLSTHLAVPFSAHLSPEGVLSWEWYRTAPRWPYRANAHLPRKVISRLYLDFIGLAEAPDEKIRRFAERWGPLRYPRSAAVSLETETIDQWRFFALLARAVVRSASLLGRDHAALPEDWRVISTWVGALWTGQPLPREGLILVAQALNLWYDRSTGNGILTLQKDQIILQPLSTSLFGILGLQLARLVTGAEASLVCFHCRRFYVPHNKPRTGSRTFCDACRRARKADLYAMRDLRARRKRQS